MTEEEKKSEHEAIAWRFWFSVAFSLFLAVTFIYYLPLRFLHRIAVEESLPMHSDETGITPVHEEMHEGAVAHEEFQVKEGLSVLFDAAPTPVIAGALSMLNFFVNEKPGNIPVPSEKLELEHTKLMHVIGVRDDMNEFFHIHPQATSTVGVLSRPYVFSKPGRYKIWSQITKDGFTHTFGHEPITVGGEGERAHKEISFGRNVIVGNYPVALKTDEPFIKGGTHELSFDIHGLTGGEVEVEAYLGADMHLAIIKDDWSQFIHTHPEDGDSGHMGIRLFSEVYAHGMEEEPGMEEENQTSSDEEINFHVVFPEAGLYRAYAQFRPKGINLPSDDALTAMFWLRVEEKAPYPISPWWILLFASAAGMVLLGAGVKKYLQVK